MDSAEAREYQRKLSSMGYDPGPIDGQPGPRTRAAAEQLRSDLQTLLNSDLLSPEFVKLMTLLEQAGWRAEETRVLPTPRAPETVGYLDIGLRRGSEQQVEVRQLQRHLRMLGYLRKGIDGAFGRGTETAVRALQYDLLSNDGSDAYGGPSAPVRVVDYNHNRLRNITGVVDAPTAACIRDMLNDPAFPTLPRAENPKDENARIRSIIDELRSKLVPVPFLRAILEQESGLKHFEIPTARDLDDFIVLGLDHNDSAHTYRITSRGYGAGQYTLFHHPPRQDEIERFMLSVEGNLSCAIKELREKFERFVNGSTSQTTADDRVREHGRGSLRVCTYQATDPRYLRDCAQCMDRAKTHTITAGETPFYAGSSGFYRLTQYHKTSSLTDVPIRRRIPCDWPYAVRRYNGSGVNSYWYQAKVLRRVAKN